MDRIRFESRALSTALLSYLKDRGWNINKIEEAFISDVPLVVPAVGIHFIQSREQERELGRTFKSFKRPVQIDVYMESRQRSQAIVDTIGDFMDEVPISITDPFVVSGASLGSMICFDTESIVLDNLNPLAAAPEVLRWRGVAKCTYDVDYITD